jgi:predicted nuclease of predicted toxin-antitoxin system
MIKFLLDENLPYDLITIVEKKGYYVEHIKKIGKTGIKNGEVYQYAQDNEMWIVTRDSDFSSLIKFDTYQIKGIFLFRTIDTSIKSLKMNLIRIIEQFENELSKKRLITVFDNRIDLYPD